MFFVFLGGTFGHFFQKVNVTLMGGNRPITYHYCSTSTHVTSISTLPSTVKFSKCGVSQSR